MESYGLSENIAALLITIPQATCNINSHILDMVVIFIISFILKDKKKFRFYFSVSVLAAILGCMVEAPVWRDTGEY